MNSLTAWKKLSSRVVHRDRWVHLRADRVEIAPGKQLDPYYVYEEPEWVHTVALNANHALLLVRQYRYPAAVFNWELPGGMADPGEELLLTAQRELREETGATAPHWRHLSSLSPNPARQTNRVHAFLAEQTVIANAPSLDSSEAIECAWHSLPAVFELIRRGEFVQANHIALLYLALDHLGWLTHRMPPASRP